MELLQRCKKLVPYMSFPNIPYPKILDDIEEEIRICIDKGLNGQVVGLQQKLERTALAHLVQTKKMRVMESEQGYTSVYLKCQVWPEHCSDFCQIRSKLTNITL